MTNGGKGAPVKFLFTGPSETDSPEGVGVTFHLPGRSVRPAGAPCSQLPLHTSLVW